MFAGTKGPRAPGGTAVATAEDGGKNALHVRVDIGSLEVQALPVLCELTASFCPPSRSTREQQPSAFGAGCNALSMIM